MLSELKGKDHQPGSHVDVKARTLGSTGGACPVGVSWGGESGSSSVSGVKRGEHVQRP